MATSADEPTTRWQRLKQSAWASLAWKAAALMGVLGFLAAMGSGAFDDWLKPSNASALPAIHKEKRSPRPATSTTAPIPTAPTGSARATTTASASSPMPSAKLPDGRLVLNLATEYDLDALPGIGMSKARAIIALRNKLGGKFKRIEDLMRVKGIKRRLIEKLRPMLALDPPNPPSPQ